MAIVLTDDAFVALDESQGLQDTGVPGANEDNNDNDIVYTDLPAAFATRLFDAGQLNLSSAFAQANGAAQNDFISLTEGSTLTGFVKADGSPLLAYDAGTTVPTTGVLAGFTTVDGEAIYLFADEASGLGSSMFLGVDANGDIVLAGYLEADGTISTVQFEAITNPDSGDHDDPVDLSGLLDVAGTGTLEFSFAALPSGQNLFGIVGPSATGPAIALFGRDVVLKSDGTFDNSSDTINTSQGGGTVTIGIDNQMFDAGDGGWFVFVKDPNQSFLAGAPGGLDQNEADDADNVLFTGGTLDVGGAFLKISQIQGGTPATLKLSAYDGITETGRDLVLTPTTSATAANITIVRVYNAAGVKIEDTGDLANFNDPAITVTGLGTGGTTISGLGAGYKVEWVTSGTHDRVLVEGIAGKFDIGAFGVTQTTTAHVPVGDRIVFEDDGPSVGDGEGTPALTVDDSDFATDDSASYANLFDVDFGTDGGKDANNDGIVDDDAVTYSLGVGGADSGLVDTLTGEAVQLSLDGLDVVGTVSGGALEVFRISVDVNTGEVTLDQSRAVVHDNPDDHEEDSEPSTLASADLITLTATATDDDGDTAEHTVDIGDTFNFEDDGPSIERNAAPAPDLIVDETIFGSTAADYSGLFTTQFGNDGPKDEDDDDLPDTDAITYALSFSGVGDDTGLVDSLTGDAVLLDQDGLDIIGVTANGSLEVFRVSVDAETGEVTLAQSRAVKHDDPLDPDEESSPAMFTGTNLVQLTATAYDGDGDHDSATIDLSGSLKFEDDGPGLGPIDGDIVDWADGQIVSNLLGAVPGADGASVKITSFTPSFDLGFATVIGVQEDDKTVVYYEDENDNGTIDTGEDTGFFQLTLDDSSTDPADWNYEFEVLRDPNLVNIEFNFDNLPSGANLFGVVGESPSDPAIIVFGKNPVFNAAGNYTNKSDVIHTSQGGTGATIGVNNQMFDPKEAAYFVYVDDPVANYLSGVPGGLTATEADDADNVQYTGGTVDVHTASLSVSQTQAGPKTSVGMKITTYLGDADQGRDLLSDPASGASPDVVLVRIFVPGQASPIEFDADADPAVMGIDVSGLGTATVTVTGLKNGYTVEWTTDDLHNRALVEATSGKFDIGKFSIAESTTAPDAELDFQVTIEDFDTNGDTAVSDFTIGIDGDHDGNVIV